MRLRNMLCCSDGCTASHFTRSACPGFIQSCGTTGRSRYPQPAEFSCWLYLSVRYFARCLHVVLRGWGDLARPELALPHLFSGFPRNSSSCILRTSDFHGICSPTRPPATWL